MSEGTPEVALRSRVSQPEIHLVSKTRHKCSAAQLRQV